MNSLEVKLNNVLRIIFGIRRLNGVPEVGATEMYRTYDLMRLESLFQLKLFKLLRALVDGKLPELYEKLLLPYQVRHYYETRNRVYRYPNLSCEVERRFLPYQLIRLHEKLPSHLLRNQLTKSVRLLKGNLLAEQ